MAPARRPHISRGTLTLFQIRVHGADVPLRVHWTLLVALPWFAAGFAPEIAARGAGGTALSWALGLLLAVALFAAVALHELAHTIVGTWLGAKVRGITLMFLGGVSQMSRPPARSGGEVLMALAGPLTSLLLAGLAALAAYPLAGMPGEVVGLFARVNVVIGVFNLLPAYPLDGGRVLRGALVYPLGPARATTAASVVGRVVALLLAAAGVATGAVFVTLIAIFIFFGASMEARAEMMTARLAGVPVGRLMEPLPYPIPEDASVAQAAAYLIAARQESLFVGRDGALVGLVTANRVARVPGEQRAAMRVSDLMEEAPAPVTLDEPLDGAFRRMNELGVDELPVMDGGRLVGVIRLDTVGRFVELLDSREHEGRGGGGAFSRPHGSPS